MSKNISFIIGIMGNGGAERVISVLSEEFINKGYDVSVITIYGNKKDYSLNKKVVYKPIECICKNKYLRCIERIFKIRKEIRKNSSSTIVSFLADVNIYVLLASLFCKTKIIISERNDPRQDPRNKYIRWIRNYIYLLSDGVVFQTDDAKEYFSNVIKSKSIVIPNPLKKNLPERYVGMRENKIVTACRLSKQKNIPMLIKAFELFQNDFSDYKLEIFGEGPLRDELTEEINNKGLSKKIFLKGFSNNIHQEILKSKMFVISSDYEGISNAMIEALAIGLPVISTDCPAGGAKMFIKNNYNGLLVPVGDVNALYNSMKQIATDDQFAEKVSVNALSIKEELDATKITEIWMNYIINIEQIDEVEKA